MAENIRSINDILFTLNLPDIPVTKANPTAIKRAFKSAADAPIATSLPSAVSWLQDHKLHVSTEPCGQAVCDMLNNLKRQKYMTAHNKSGKCTMHPFLALVAISEALDMDIYVFSTLTRPFYFQAKRRKGTIALLHHDKDQFYPVTRQALALDKAKVKEPDYPKAQRRSSDNETLTMEKLSLLISETDLKSRVHQAMVSSAIDFYEKHHLLATGKKKQTKDELKEKVENTRSVQHNFWNNLAKQLVVESLAPADILGYHVKKEASANENWVAEWATYVTEICDKGQEKPASRDEQRANRLPKTVMHKVIAAPLSYTLRSGLDPAVIGFALDQEQQNLSIEIGVMTQVLDGLIRMVGDGRAAQCFGDKSPMDEFAWPSMLPAEFRKGNNATTPVWLPKEETVTKMREDGLLSYRHLSRLATVYLKKAACGDTKNMKEVFAELKREVPIPEPSTKFRQRAAFQALLRELRSSRFHIWQKPRFLYDLRLILRLSLQAHLRPDDLKSYLDPVRQNVSLDDYGKTAETMRLCDRVALGLVGQDAFSTSEMIQHVASIGHEDKKRRRTKEEKEQDGPMSREVLISLLEVAMQLCQSADIKQDATEEDLQNLWKGDGLADDYVQTTLSIVNELRPFVPKPSQEERVTYDIFSCAPIHFISEQLLQQLGVPSDYQQSITHPPKVTLPLNAETLYDIFSHDYIFFSKANRPITSMKDAALKKEETIANFFNPEAILHVLKDYQPSVNMRYVDSDTTLWYGTKLIAVDVTSDEVKELDNELLELNKQHNESNKQVVQVVHHHTEWPEEQVWEQWSAIRSTIRETRTRKYTLQKSLLIQT
ncbi:hypothetical protein BJV82DRAFT_636973 [Fennellomyces sp. T-0311]|nr:hypothetical protein BJV82DRAFT_636973 [Fennellomyces sp. T-0311]